MVAAVAVAVTVGQQAVKANSARKAAKAQIKGIEAGKKDLNTGFDKAQTYQDPYIKAGEQSISRLTEGTKAGGEFDKTFGASDFQADPGYGFRKSEGLKAVEQGAAARGGALSGAAIKGAQRFGQDLASQEYQSAYARFNNDMNTRFNRLDQLANRGQHAADFSSQSEQNRGISLGNLSVNKGNVLAAKEIAYGNAGANSIGAIANSYTGGTGLSTTYGDLKV